MSTPWKDWERETLMLGLIEAGDAKRRCVVNPSAMPSSLANSVP